jgi:beta-glucosidase
MSTHHDLKEIVKQGSSLVKGTGGFAYRDLNKNGRLDIYEDPRQPIEARVEDLLSQMTLEEKAGTLFINGVVVNEDGSLEEKPGAPGFGGIAKTQMVDCWMNHFNLWQIPSPTAVAKWYNNLQKFAESTRLGIPVTIASDPRNHFSSTIFSMAAHGFSQWCETPGFGALDDPELVRASAALLAKMRKSAPGW